MAGIACGCDSCFYGSGMVAEVRPSLRQGFTGDCKSINREIVRSGGLILLCDYVVRFEQQNDQFCFFLKYFHISVNITLLSLNIEFAEQDS